MGAHTKCTLQMGSHTPTCILQNKSHAVSCTLHVGLFRLHKTVH